VNIADVLIAVAAPILIRVEDLGGDDAMAELARPALGQDHASS
jgi:hypothetical protein